MSRPPKEPYLELLSKSFAKATRDPQANYSVEGLIHDGERELGFKVLAGHKGLEKKLTSNKIQKPGLALAGYLDYLESGRVQIVGRGEIAFLSQLDSEKLENAARGLFESGVTCLAFTRNQAPPKRLLELAEEFEVPLLQSPLGGGDLVEGIIRLLDCKISPKIHFHGNFVAVSGLGVLILGRSGVGKSEVALDLIMRGHQLISDDIVQVRRTASGELVGSSDELIQDHMEIRGLGIINVKDLFSITASSTEHKVDFALYLERWNPDHDYQMIDLDVDDVEILGVPVPLIHLPVAPGRNITNLIEVVARDQLLKRMGHHTARAFSKKVERCLTERRARRSTFGANLLDEES